MRYRKILAAFLTIFLLAEAYILITDAHYPPYQQYAVDNVELPSEGCEAGRDDVYTVNPVNKSGLRRAYFNVPDFYVRTNRYGLREDSFQRDKPSNLTRILVIGDSFTYGWGVKVSNRYTDVTERILNNKSSRRVQVISAGVPAYGMLDYCLFLRHRASRINPDIIVVSFNYYDAAPRRLHDEAWAGLHPLLSVLPRPVENVLRNQRAVRAQTLIVQNMVLNESAAVPAYMERMDTIAEKGGMNLVFYQYQPFHGYEPRVNKEVNVTRFFREFVAEKGIPVIWAPREFSNHSSSEYSLPDDHYNELGHRWLGQKLARRLAERYPDILAMQEES